MSSKEQMSAGGAAELVSKVIGFDGYQRGRGRGGSRFNSALNGLAQVAVPLTYETVPPNRDFDTISHDEGINRRVEALSHFLLLLATVMVAWDEDFKKIAIIAAAKGIYNLNTNLNYSDENPQKR